MTPAISPALQFFLTVLDFIGTFVFALSGAAPPSSANWTSSASWSCRSWRQPPAAWSPVVDRLQNPVQLFDAAGLALFAVTGAQKALAYGLDPPMAALLGMLTGIGGGMARDIMLTEIPHVLRAALYAVAALAGAGVVMIGELLDVPSMTTTLAGAAVCFGLRLGSIYWGWHLPKATPSKSTGGNPRSR